MFPNSITTTTATVLKPLTPVTAGVEQTACQGVPLGSVPG